jgi:hypothetical protein
MKNLNFERCVHVLKLNPLELGIIVFHRTLAFLWSCCKWTLLLVTNLKPYVKVIKKLKIFLSSHGFQFPALDTIIGCEVRFVDCLLIARRTTKFTPFDASYISCNYELSLWHSPRFNMCLQLFVELIHNLNKCFNHYEIVVAIGTLSHYLFNC